ncbi:LppA family lipoprotein [Mycolicibacterium sp.]|uniref:LppA family lipoprotein n=1 Tax=Mycolicibacterium sp. TaxID=2320850 RepID=UPI001A297DB5|nr:LppA family lipoprotein [Mycolicibacterium sp.]MBJ7336212.1 LppA family lipoprotein [Mycolicibacterium sp.]
MKAATALLAAALCLATQTGCSFSPAEQEDAAPRDPEARLRERPSFEAAQKQYLTAVTDTANQIAAAVPGLTWDLTDNTWGGCGGEFVDTKGVYAYVSAVFNGPTPEQSWPTALQIVKDNAARLGATDLQPFVDRPANHDVIFTGPDGVEVTFGTAKATVLSAKSDCRLREKPRPQDGSG